MYNHPLKYLLKNDSNKVISRGGIIIRRLLSPLLRYVAAPLTTKNKLVIESCERLPKGQRLIFAATHGFVDDITMSMRAAGRHTYLLYGSLPDFFKTFHGIALWISGVILVDRSDRASRQAAKEKMVRALKLGTDILMFPEGVWNKSPNQIMLKLFPGIYDVATETGALIVPIASVEERGRVYVIMEKAFDITRYSRKEGLKILRDKMSTAKYGLMEKYAMAKRSEFPEPEKYWYDFIESLIAATGYHYDRAVEDRAHFIDKSIVDYESAFEHLRHIVPCRENAFLFNAHLK